MQIKFASITYLSYSILYSYYFLFDSQKLLSVTQLHTVTLIDTQLFNWLFTWTALSEYLRYGRGKKFDRSWMI